MNAVKNGSARARTLLVAGLIVASSVVHVTTLSLLPHGDAHVAFPPPKIETIEMTVASRATEAHSASAAQVEQRDVSAGDEVQQAPAARGVRHAPRPQHAGEAADESNAAIPEPAHAEHGAPAPLPPAAKDMRIDISARGAALSTLPLSASTTTQAAARDDLAEQRGAALSADLHYDRERRSLPRSQGTRPRPLPRWHLSLRGHRDQRDGSARRRRALRRQVRRRQDRVGATARSRSVHPARWCAGAARASGDAGGDGARATGGGSPAFRRARVEGRARVVPAPNRRPAP